MTLILPRQKPMTMQFTDGNLEIISLTTQRGNPQQERSPPYHTNCSIIASQPPILLCCTAADNPLDLNTHCLFDKLASNNHRERHVRSRQLPRTKLGSRCDLHSSLPSIRESSYSTPLCADPKFLSRQPPASSKAILSWTTDSHNSYTSTTKP